MSLSQFQLLGTDEKRQRSSSEQRSCNFGILPKESDVFHWAQVGVEMIRQSFPKLMDPETRLVRFPSNLMHVLECCLDDDPAERYDPVLIVRMLEEVEFSLCNQNIEWLDDDYDLPKIRKRVLSSTNLPANWSR